MKMSPSKRLATGHWYSPAEVARLLGVLYPTVQTYARQLADQLQALRDERDRLHFSEADLEVLRRHHARRAAKKPESPEAGRAASPPGEEGVP